MIEITKDKNFLRYPTAGYLKKGNYEYEKGNYNKALDLYLIAVKYAKQNDNKDLYFRLKFNIGLLKNNVGETQESRAIFVEYLNFQDQNPSFKQSRPYILTLFALADSYVGEHKELDSAKKYIDKGIKETLISKNLVMYPYFVVRSGIYHYHSKDYNKAIDSLQRAKTLIEKQGGEKIRMAVCDYYTAISYDELGKSETSIEFFKNVDSILKETKDILPILLNSYPYLIDYYKSKNDVENQLKYVNALLKLDSIRDKNRIYLTKNIIKRYDTVELISEKEKLIDQLQDDQSLKRETILTLIVILIIIAILGSYGYYKNHTNKKRFLKLIEQSSQVKNTGIKRSRTTQISKDALDHLKQKLEEFEEQEEYLNANINAKDLAKKFDSNSSYLSIAVNTYKQKSISQYINDLRIDYVIERLQTDQKLRKYTIKAIAKEIGFNSAEVFAKTFHKNTGIYPSYFIKKLEKHIENIED